MAKYDQLDAQLKAKISALFDFPAAYLFDVQLEVDTCAKEMMRLRSGSVCTTCSGRNNVFFSNGKPLIPEPTCKSAVNACFNSFMILARMSELAAKTSDYLKALVESQLFEANDINIPEFVYPRLSLLKNLFCNSSGPLSTCHNLETFSVKAVPLDWLCSNFVRLGEASLFEEAYPLLSLLDLTLTKIDIYLGQRKEKCRTSSFQLATLVNTTDFIGSTIVLSSDSMFDPITSGTNELDQKRAMNLSMIFP